MQRKGSLTRFPAGSFREVCAIALPLMLAMFSSSLMMFCDRLILARYSTEVMNATTVMWEVAAVFHFLPVGTAMIIEVFVGRCNGAGRLKEAGSYTWQMLWFSLATLVVFVPLAHYGAIGARAWLPGVELGIPYFRWILLFGPIFAAAGTLNAYFVGLGRVKIVTLVAIGANALNIALDLWFVMELDHGSAGAALATGFSQILGLIVLAIVFFNRHHRTNYGSARWHLRPKMLWETLRIGVPSALAHLIEIAAWAALMQMLTLVGAEYVTVTAIGQGLFFLFAFTTEGLQKGVATIGANLLGANRRKKLGRLVRSSLLLHFSIVAVLAIPLIGFPRQMVELFLPDVTGGPLFQQAILALYFVWGYFLLDGIVWVFAGIVTAGGDTRFVMVMNGLAAWLFAIAPNYVGLFWLHMSPAWVWPLKLLYPAVNAFCFYLRYKSGRWIKEIATATDELESSLAPSPR